MTPASVGVSNYCAMWSNAPGAIWTSATDHCIGVSPVEGHSCQECRGSECCEHDSAHLWPPLNLGEKKPRQLAGASSARYGMLHFSLARFTRGVPSPASLRAGSLCLCLRHIPRSESGSGESHCKPKSNNRCNYLIHRLLLVRDRHSLTRTEAGTPKT